MAGDRRGILPNSYPFLCNRRCACDAYELHGIVESELCYVQMFMEMTFGNPFLQS